MSVFVQIVRILFLVAVCCSGAYADSHPSGFSLAVGSDGAETPGNQDVSENKSENRALPRLAYSNLTDRSQEHTTLFPGPFGLETIIALRSEVSAKWAELQSRILAEERTLAACRSGDGPCPAAARRFMSIIELGLQRQGRARLGEINRAVNLSIKPMSDWAQYGVDDFWAAPLAALSNRAGDCEDYAIVKYVALHKSGIVPDDLRLVIVRDINRQTNHAVLAVRYEEEWLILDNRTMVMVNAEQARHYYPLFVLDHRSVRTFATATVRH